MNRRLSTYINLCLVVLSSFCLTSFRPSRISKNDAIKMAEQFIKRNGYTTAAADTSTYQLSFTMYDNTLLSLKPNYNTDSVLKHRYNTFHPKAFCILYYDKGETWHVGFLLTSVNIGQLDSVTKNSDLPGRVVSVDRYGVRVEHKIPAFSKFEKL